MKFLLADGAEVSAAVWAERAGFSDRGFARRIAG